MSNGEEEDAASKGTTNEVTRRFRLFGKVRALKRIFSDARVLVIPGFDIHIQFALFRNAISRKQGGSGGIRP